MTFLFILLDVCFKKNKFTLMLFSLVFIWEEDRYSGLWGRCGFEFQCFCLLGLWLWVSYLVLLNISFLIFEMGTIILNRGRGSCWEVNEIEARDG